MLLAAAAGDGGADGDIIETILSFLNEGGPVVSYRQGGGIMGDSMMEEPMSPTPPSPGGILGAQPPADAGIMGESIMDKPMPSESMMGGEMSQMDITMMSDEPMSEIDKAEGILQSLAAASGGTLKIKRKSKGGK